MTTGILVIPFKFRDSKTFSGDATIGPYVGFRNDYITTTLSLGLSQIAIAKEKDKVKNETGLTFSAGFIFKVNDHFDIALIAGQDRVFGEAREQFEHQGDWWFSFGIGYKFTK